MPAEAVGLHLHVEGIDTDRVDEIQETILTIGFQPDPHEEGMVGGIINFQPFENTDANRELVDECVDQISSEFPELDVAYEIKRNRDRGKVIARICRIYVKNI